MVDKKLKYLDVQQRTLLNPSLAHTLQVLGTSKIDVIPPSPPGITGHIAILGGCPGLLITFFYLAQPLFMTLITFLCVACPFSSHTFFL